MKFFKKKGKKGELTTKNKIPLLNGCADAYVYHDALYVAVCRGNNIKLLL